MTIIHSYVVFAGILIMAYSLHICVRIRANISSEEDRRSWLILLLLIAFFLFGYIGVFILALPPLGEERIPSIIAWILFFGAVFVLTVLRFTLSLLKRLSSEVDDLKRTKSNLKRSNTSLEKAEKDLAGKNKKLLDTIDDFYSIRLSMGRKEEDRMKRENKNISSRIRKLKK